MNVELYDWREEDEVDEVGNWRRKQRRVARIECVWCARKILDYILAVLLSDTRKAAQSHGTQDDYLLMKMSTKFMEVSARSWPKPN